MVEAEGSGLRWGTEQRLEFIEFRCFWEGGIRRGDITDTFGVSVPQASNDLSLYQKMEPENLRYDTREKRYVPTASFKPRFLNPSANRYLAQLKSVADDVIGIEETWISHAPPADSLPIPFRSIKPSVLKAMVGLIRSRQSAEIYYQSMSSHRTGSIWRRITPHAFGSDGLRWHVRAFCHLDGNYKDFILSRCEDIRNEGPAGGLDIDDKDWNNFFEVILCPNPDLSEPQRRTVALDYAMSEGKVCMPVRYAMLYYFQKRLRLDVSSPADRPAERPVVVENWEEFKSALPRVGI
jgi:hypothetical protein